MQGHTANKGLAASLLAVTLTTMWPDYGPQPAQAVLCCFTILQMFPGLWHDHEVDTSAHQLLSSQKCVPTFLMGAIPLLSPTTLKAYAMEGTMLCAV